MSERIYPLGNTAHLDLQKGALVLFRAQPGVYLPEELTGIRYDAVFGGAPDTYFPIWPNRAQYGSIDHQDKLPLSADSFSRRIDIGVTRDSPYAVARWMPDTLNSEGFRVLELFILQGDGQIMEYVMSWNSEFWDIHDSYPINLDEVHAQIPDLYTELSTLQPLP